jgi:hypothetical protein
MAQTRTPGQPGGRRAIDESGEAARPGAEWRPGACRPRQQTDRQTEPQTDRQGGCRPVASALSASCFDCRSGGGHAQVPHGDDPGAQQPHLGCPRQTDRPSGAQQPDLGRPRQTDRPSAPQQPHLGCPRQTDRPSGPQQPHLGLPRRAWDKVNAFDPVVDSMPLGDHLAEGCWESTSGCMQSQSGVWVPPPTGGCTPFQFGESTSGCTQFQSGEWVPPPSVAHLEEDLPWGWDGCDVPFGVGHSHSSPWSPRPSSRPGPADWSLGALQQAEHGGWLFGPVDGRSSVCAMGCWGDAAAFAQASYPERGFVPCCAGAYVMTEGLGAGIFQPALNPKP